MTAGRPRLRFSGPLAHPTMPASWTVVSVPESKAVFSTGRAVGKQIGDIVDVDVTQT